MRKESLEELTSYGQIMDLVTNSPKNIVYLMLGSLKYVSDEIYIYRLGGGPKPPNPINFIQIFLTV